MANEFENAAELISHSNWHVPIENKMLHFELPHLLLTYAKNKDFHKEKIYSNHDEPLWHQITPGSLQCKECQARRWEI